MIEGLSSQDVVLALVRVISGDSPRRTAETCLHPRVKIHMDRANHCGITIWSKWIHLIRNCGRVRDLRMTPIELQCDPQDPSIVHLSILWSGTYSSDRSPARSAAIAHLRYLVRDGRIVEIWSHKRNYVFIFGPWIRYSACYRLFLGWAIFYFAIRSFRHDEFCLDAD